MSGARSSQAAKVDAWVLKYHPSVKPIYDKTPMQKENNPQLLNKDCFGEELGKYVAEMNRANPSNTQRFPAPKIELLFACLFLKIETGK